MSGNHKQGLGVERHPSFIITNKHIIIGPCELYLGDCFELIPKLGEVQAVITDPPFSSRTHDRHNAAVKNLGTKRADRNILNYQHWEIEQVKQFSLLCNKVCFGWIAVITDDILAHRYKRAMEKLGRVTFPSLPFYDPGRSCRLHGDGPSSWTDWIIVSRTKAQNKWGTLPGGYIRKAGSGKKFHHGGKPISLMVSLVRDYSRKGDIVLDPCMGAGTTGVACLRMGRKFIGIEKDPETFEKAAARIKAEYRLVSSSLFAK